jgi:type 1 glutamine amidotransferase
MKTLIKSILFIVGISLLTLSSCQNGPKSDAPYKALIITGQNNHNWEASTPILKEILDNSSLFDTYIAKSPAKGEDMSTFVPVFTDYDLIVLDYNGDSWPQETKDAFVSFVSGGGGVVVYHAADNAFPDWPEYNQITGLGGWGDRSEKDGPYLRWKDGEIVRDMSPGRGGSHGQQHEFVITNRVTDHPITRGLPEKWLHGQDELYSQLRGPAENLTVLATSFADTSKGGTGEHEPMLMTINYGQGRVFHTVLGHVGGPDSQNPAAKCVGFIVTLQRGAEWAVSGDVTQEVPDAFPGANTTSFWDKFRPYSLEELMDCMTNYEFGDSRTCLQDLAYMIRNASSDETELKLMEKRLIKFLNSKASADAKNFVLEQISLIGTSESESTLKKLLNDENTKEMARFALERISSDYTNN